MVQAVLAPILGTATAAASTGALAVASTVLGVGGTLLQGQASLKSAEYNMAVMARVAEQERVNAENAVRGGSERARDADAEAVAVMGDVLSSQAASGFQVTSPSFLRRRAKNKRVADTNRQRIKDDAEATAESARNRQLDAHEKIQAEADSYSPVATLLNVGNSLISGATLYGDLKARRLRNSAAGVD